MKIKYLQAMGVTTWRLHGIPCYRLWDAQDQCCGVLIASLNTPLEQELFAAILQALGVRVEESQWVETDAKRTVSLGAHATACHQTYSLAEMLKNPLLKSQVWQALRKYL